MEHIAISNREGKVSAKGDSLIVSFDYTQQTKCPVPKSIREAAESLGKQS
jgi:acyl-CoA thioesterase FadM